MSFVSKVDDQKKELVAALFRNLALKERTKHLETECKELADRVIENQLAFAEENENNIVLKKELNDLKREHEIKVDELKKADQQIATLSLVLEDEKSSIDISLNEDKSVNENLKIKDEMINCLQEQLLKVRLNEAEIYATIRDLKKNVRELEIENQTLINSKPETISRLQEQIMEHRARENTIYNEFVQIKVFLENMKMDIQQHIEAQGDETTKDVEGKIAKFTKKGVRWERSSKTKTKEIEEAEQRIARLKDEAEMLRNKMIPELQNQIEDTTKKILVKEKVRSDLQEKIENAAIKDKSVKSIISERKRQCELLENNATEKLSGIGTSKLEKKKNIFKLSEKFENLSRNQSYQSLTALDNEEESIVKELEEKVKYLEEKIADLSAKKLTTLNESL